MIIAAGALTVTLLVGLIMRDYFVAPAAPWLSWLAINIALAWIPLFLSSITISANSRLALLLIMPLWLLFLPNSLYLATDLIYLRMQTGRFIWIDSIILLSIALLGLHIGALSFYQMFNALHQSFKPIFAQSLFIIAPIAVGIGVYIGRFLRWNSWDVIANPRALMIDISNIFYHPIYNLNAWIFIMSFGAMFFAILIIYLSIINV